MPVPDSIVIRALDPARSVVVEACAGSGKTWLLASRIVRLLLAGVAPGEILAITFTRKAACEIEERVVDWLQFMATCDVDALSSFLAERGVAAEGELIRSAQGLYERALMARPGITVNTFHGWFLQLIDGAPLTANLAGASLVETDSRLFEELWQSFAASLQKLPDSELVRSFVRVLDQAGLDSARRMIRRGLDRRSEWLAFGSDGGAAQQLEILRRQFGVEGECGRTLDVFFDSDCLPDLQAYLGFLEMSELKGDQEAAVSLRRALSETDRGVCFDGLRSVLLTKEGTLRSRKPGKSLDQRFTPAGAERFLGLHLRLGERVLDCLERQRAERIVDFNRDVFLVFEAFLAHVEAFKRARRQIDFVDAEWNVLGLLRDPDTAAFLQARLDSRYSHVLLDEFQDTNPLQWQIMLAWLAAYSDASRPGVFLVGDPKQSIYRFRRAEPRLFSVASEFLMREYAAVRCEQDVTRRNAQPIVDVVNALFLGVAEFEPFRKQSSLAGDLPGRVELLPLFGKDALAGIPEPEGGKVLRDPLSEPDVEPEDLRLRMEAEALAVRLGEMVGRSGEAWLIEDKGAGGASDARRRLRPLRFGDIMLLVRTRTGLACYERALTAAGIPFDAGSRGGLLKALEARDIVALLEFLVTPMADLKLAHVLRAPVFACTDGDLMQLALRQEPSWWQRLLAMVEVNEASPRLQRAAQLLAQWLQAAERLPVHDLLDRIYHQGEVLERYRLAVAGSASASVQANLRALLLLALDLDGGRYPGLPRFIDELRELHGADANDSPDEGVIESHDLEAGRVRILTIHGAKGLEAPVVWLLGANASPRARDAWDVLVDWPPESSSPRHFSFFGRKEDRGLARQPIFDDEAITARREELNLLYVALTRARQVFIASGIENARGQGDTSYRRLEVALQRLAGGPVHGQAMPSAAMPENPPTQPVSPVILPLPRVGERRRAADAAERFGILLHALLERRTGGVEQRAETEHWWMGLGFDESEYQRVRPVAEQILSAENLRRFFDPSHYRRAWNEIDLVTRDGEVKRLDRLIEFDGVYWVLDYKSSRSDTNRLADYRAQVADYCRAVAGVFPGNEVHGALVFSDASVLDVC